MNYLELQTRNKTRVSKYTILFISLWTVVIIISFLWNNYNSRNHAINLARDVARSQFFKDYIYRLWNARHGGVYVPITESTKPNQYLSDIKNRDIETVSGLKLTLMNPAYMTRQVHELGKKKERLWGHITSLKPIRPGNIADPWEKKVLLSFEQKAKEFSSIEIMNGEPFMRFMRPLVTVKSCLKCHEKQGYKVGDIRGGISVSVPMKTYFNIADKQVFQIGVGHFFFWMIGFVGIVLTSKRINRHISDSRIARSELRKSEIRYRSLYLDTPAMLHSIDKKGVILSVSNLWLDKMGYLREEVIGKELSDFLTEESRQNEKTVFFPDFLEKGYCNDIYYQFKKKSGKLMDVLLSAIAEKNQDGEIVSSFAVIRDITERKIAEKEKLELEKQLLQSQKMEAIGTLAGGIAHDFNNMLSIIMGYTEISIDEMQDNDQVRENLTKVLTSSKRAKEMIQQILAFSRKDDQTMISISIEKVIKETINFLRSSIPTTIEIKTNLQKNIGLIYGNATQINQVLMNLCSNASYAMSENGGILEIILKKATLDKESADLLNLNPGVYLHLIISDTGSGMDKETKERVFEPYFTTKKQGEGTGLGLAVVYGIVKKHGGEINLKSELGKGTTFNVYFPALETGHFKKEIDTEKMSFKGNNERILYVDDETSIATLVTQIIKKLGYQVESRTSSIEALELFKNNPDKFDLIISDMTMPKMTGVKLANEIHKIKPDLPIIICTGFSNSINNDNYKRQGISALVMKPIVKKELGEAIQKVFNKK